jgi:BarA-like signal transduction histidine kinase
MDEKDRVRFTALQRRKLQRFEDIVDDLEDLVTDGSPSSAELEARQGVIAEFREDARRLNASFAGGTPSVVAEDPPETVLGKLEHIADAVKSEAARVTGEVNAAVAGAASAATAAQKKQEEAAAVRGLSSQELLQLQRSQMRKQDDAMDHLDSLVGKLKMTSNMIREEVDVQARMVEDLDKDFSHTQSRMKKLRKQGFKLAGEKNGEEKEKMERAEAMEEMKKNLPSHQRELAQQKQQSGGGECVVM